MSARRSPRLVAAQVALWREAAEVFRRHAPQIVAAAQDAGWERPSTLALLAAPFVGILRDCVAGAVPKGAEAGLIDRVMQVALEQASESLAQADILEGRDALHH